MIDIMIDRYKIVFSLDVNADLVVSIPSHRVRKKVFKPLLVQRIVATEF